MARWNDVALSPSLWQALGREAEAQRSFRKSEALQREKARAGGGAGAGAGAGSGRGCRPPRRVTSCASLT